MARKIQPTVPFDLPQFVLNPLSVKAFNTLYYALGPGGEGKLVDYNRYFFPLDFIHDWNRLYGKRGFVQYQVTVPLGEREGLVEILQTAARSGRASFLAVLKKFGPGSDGLLSHPFEGYTLTLDFAVTEGLTEFMHELDRITLDHGGRLYLAKDVAMTAETFRASYPRLEAFQAVRGRLDPGGMLGSNLSRRLAITKGGA